METPGQHGHQDLDMQQAIFQKTQREVQLEQMGPAMNRKEVSRRHGHFWNVARRFGVRQGVEASGAPKFRSIDDHTENKNNEAAERKQKVSLATVHLFLLILRMLVAAFPKDVWPDIDADPQGSSEDMKAAYRQCPLAVTNISLAITAVFNPNTQMVDFHEMWGSPFGAAHAVHNFNRLAEWLNRVIRRMLFMVLEHYFDDFTALEPAFSLPAGMWVFRETLRLMGFSLDPDKSQPPSDVLISLGVLFSMTMVRTTLRIPLRPKPGRLEKIQEEIQEIKNLGVLPPGHAAQCVGKLQFLASTLYGKVGRAALGPLRHRQYQGSPPYPLTHDIKASLEWWLKIDKFTPPRELPVYPNPVRPTILYTDGQESPTSMTIAGVLDSPRSPHLRFFRAAITPEVVALWLPKKAMINQIEAAAGVVALDTWSELLQDVDLIHFIDSNTALSCTIKGHSSKTDTTLLVGEYWLRAAQLRAFIYLDRVESLSNLADGPTKNELALLQEMGAIEDTPVLDSLYRQTLSPVC
jgi:hypothetical protein